MQATRAGRGLGLKMLAAFLAVAIAATGCRATDGGETSDGDTFRVGVLLGLTGNYAALGEPERAAIELYFDRLNEQGGINGRDVELVVADSASDESEAVNQLRKLATQENVHAVLGPSSSGEGIALKPVSKSLQVPTIALASSEDIVNPVDEAEYMFRQYTSTPLSLQAQLEYVQEQGWNRVALLAANDGYGQDPVNMLPDMVSDYDAELVASEVFPPDSTDMTAQLTRIARGNPDVVLVWSGVAGTNAVIARNARSIGLDAQLFHSPGAGSKDFITNGGAAADGTLVQASKINVDVSRIPKDDPQYDVMKNFADAYQAEYGNAPGQYAGNGWDGARILETALEGVAEGTTGTQEVRDAIRDSLEQDVNGVVGINAIYTFDEENHDPSGTAGLAIIGVKNGKFTLVKSFE